MKRTFYSGLLNRLVIFFTAIILFVACNKPFADMQADDLLNLKNSFAAADEPVINLPDSPVSVSQKYQVFINDIPVRVSKEICYDYIANGGTRVTHSSLFTYQPGAQIKIITDSSFSSYTLSPQRLGISTSQVGNEITFTLPSEYYNFAITFPDREPLFLFSAPDLTSYKTGAVVFDSGVHTPANGEFHLQSNTTYYLEEGAVLNGKVIISNKTNVKIFGRGMIDDRLNPVVGHFLKIYNSSNVEIKGIGIRHGALGWQTDFVNSSNIQVDYINLMSFGQNNDGLDIGTGCKNISFKNCFVGSGDDAFGWHATNAIAYGQNPLDSSYAENCLVWQTAGCGIRIGSSLEATEVKNLQFKNIDIAKTSKGIYPVAIPHSDWADVHNLVFENIYDEEPSNTKFVLAYIKQTHNSNPVYQPGFISNIQFINCNSFATKAEFEGYDPIHKISDITFINCTVAGRPMLQSDVVANAFTENIIVQ
ncbi:glycosyl hydrolase family 28 protein [Gynurincola endophyticus]|uniref:glycosyl hydrolase family 28 protein n=1 Tax=Gynurincola endophyticus TaxID=2479004 RepID=UPI000F8E2CA8|nr:glycosyl hydrolase family 28 protein [Gynurincola endophyticus]